MVIEKIYEIPNTAKRSVRHKNISTAVLDSIRNALKNCMSHLEYGKKKHICNIYIHNVLFEASNN